MNFDVRGRDLAFLAGSARPDAWCLGPGTGKAGGADLGERASQHGCCVMQSKVRNDRKSLLIQFMQNAVFLKCSIGVVLL